jgi:hypothetical protein
VNPVIGSENLVDLGGLWKELSFGWYPIGEHTSQQRAVAWCAVTRRRNLPPTFLGYDPPEGWSWCYMDKVVTFPIERRITVQSRAITAD